MISRVRRKEANQAKQGRSDQISENMHLIRTHIDIKGLCDCLNLLIFYFIKCIHVINHNENVLDLSGYNLTATIVCGNPEEIHTYFGIKPERK